MSDKKIRLLVDLTYDAEMAHGDDKGAIEWFNDILMGDDLQLCSFSEFGDTIGKVKAVDQQEAGRIEELEAKMTWQPIETAPRSGQTILVCLPRMMNLIVRATYSTVYGYWRTDFETEGGTTNPTFFHAGDVWMPLPEPPTLAELKGQDDEEV